MSEPPAPRFINLDDYAAAAAAVVDRVHMDYVMGASRDELTSRANIEAFRQVQLLPRVLRGREPRDLTTTLLGQQLSMPVLVSPTAFHKLFHPDGEAATSRAAAAAGTVNIISMAATTPVADVVAAARARTPGADSWFQLYIQPDADITRTLVRRATEAGCTALVVTVDSPVLGVNERNRRNAFHDLPPGLRCENLVNLRDDEPGHVRQIVMSADISWRHVEQLIASTDLPVLLKGVLHPGDAVTALDLGVSGLLLSNHGGRQLDGVPSTLELLPEIVAATRGQVPVVLDGGVRRGTDVVKALALGATAVGIGRPVIWGLATGGEAGVRGVLEVLREEVDEAVALVGAGSVGELGPQVVRRPGWSALPPTDPEALTWLPRTPAGAANGGGSWQ